MEGKEDKNEWKIFCFERLWMSGSQGKSCLSGELRGA